MNYLTAKQEFNDGYIRVIKSRLQKKLAVFVNQELPVLIEKGYLYVTEFRNGSITEKTITERKRGIAWLGYRRRLTVNEHLTTIF